MRLGVSTHSLYSWMERYAVSPAIAVKDDQTAAIRRLKQELARVTDTRQPRPEQDLPDQLQQISSASVGEVRFVMDEL